MRRFSIISEDKISTLFSEKLVNSWCRVEFLLVIDESIDEEEDNVILEVVFDFEFDELTDVDDADFDFEFDELLIDDL